MSFLFGFEGGMWVLTVLIPDHCLPIYFYHISKTSQSHSLKTIMVNWNKADPKLSDNRNEITEKALKS